MEGVFEMKINWKSKILACVTSLIVAFGAPFCAALTSEEALRLLNLYFGVSDNYGTMDPIPQHSTQRDRLDALASRASDMRTVVGAWNDQLHDLQRSSNGNPVLSLISDHPELVNVSLGDGRSLLHHAIEKHFTSVVDGLIKMGACLESIDDKGYTPLLLAIIKGYSDIVDKLLDGGADPNHKFVPKNVTPLSLALHGTDKPNKAIIDALVSHGAKEYDYSCCCCTIM